MTIQPVPNTDYISPSVELLDITHEGILCESTLLQDSTISDMTEVDFPWNS